MRGEYQDILDKISNDNLDHHFNQYIYIPRSNITRAFTYKKIGPNNINSPKTDKKSKYSRSNHRVKSDSKGKKEKIPKTHSSTKGKESSSITRGVPWTQETGKSPCTHTQKKGKRNNKTASNLSTTNKGTPKTRARENQPRTINNPKYNSKPTQSTHKKRDVPSMTEGSGTTTTNQTTTPHAT